MDKTFHDLIDKMSTYLWLPENGTSRMHTISKHVYGTVVYHIMFSNRNVNQKSMLYIRQTKHEVHCQHIYIYIYICYYIRLVYLVMKSLIQRPTKRTLLN